jgi:hypothetical protein
MVIPKTASIAKIEEPKDADTITIEDAKKELINKELPCFCHCISLQ